MTTEEYIKAHNASGFKEGDKVFITRKAEDFENGWNMRWFNPMDYMVGKELVISSDQGMIGFQMETGFCYPYFILEKR